MRYFSIIVIALSLFFCSAVSIWAGPLTNPQAVYGEGTPLSWAGTATGFNTNQSLSGLIASIIKGFLSLLGMVFIILIIYAGFTWMTAGGDESKVKTAKDTIQKAIIGLVIIVAAYAITYFIFNFLPWQGESGTGSGGSSSGVIDTNPVVPPPPPPPAP